MHETETSRRKRKRKLQTNVAVSTPHTYDSFNNDFINFDSGKANSNYRIQSPEAQLNIMSSVSKTFDR